MGSRDSGCSCNSEPGEILSVETRLRPMDNRARSRRPGQDERTTESRRHNAAQPQPNQEKEIHRRGRREELDKARRGRTGA